ncbi:cytochrome c-type biogenesis protein [Novibacillus thermophilus]|uniref:Cytochrome c-type biogenesis protein n=1 Tax=Novibacillus thermophilus TaxID=1471761 RepID=A0A1U9K6T3_9BACL|nr:cytochrome c-type biogenesis protein CcmH [Novibacillus thermophilus]AQS55732.1 hypothetical protein B0W44_07930 [Novibacillus thermophilus]
MVKVKHLMALVILAFLMMGGHDAWAAGNAPSQKVPVSRADVLDVAKEIHPPGCTHSMTADYCTLTTAYETRAEIAELLGQGMNKQEVLDTLIAKYGERILASPPARGFNLLPWVLPGVSIVIGAAAVTFFVRSWANGEEDSGNSSERNNYTVSPADERDVQEELKHWI